MTSVNNPYPSQKFDREGDPKKHKEKPMPIIQTTNLTKIYGQGETAVTAIDHINLKVEASEFVAVMGPSGCGKSTLLHLLGGLDRPSEGQVMIDNHNLIPVLTAAENAALPLLLDGGKADQAKNKAAEWLEKVGLADRSHHRPDQLSGGQQQRVAIARALVTYPDLILADEPTGNLDSRAGDEIARLLSQVSNTWGRAIVMVTHDPRIAAYASRIIFLKDGRVVDETRLVGNGEEQANALKAKVDAL
jgi:putative ABC transport system ATP-binding protein